MRRFITQTVLLTFPLLCSCYLVFIQADGYTDPFYKRFTTPRQFSFVLGTSRAAQSIQPKYLHKILSRNDIFNYSFTIDHSPYGPNYLNSIKKKLRPDSKVSIFILAVDPWSLSSRSKDPNDSSQFPELKLALANTSYVNINPNIPYLLNNYNYPLYTLLLKSQSAMYLHNDGWLEVTVPMDTLSVANRIKDKVLNYEKENLPYYKYSMVRLNYLEKTIEFLNDYGKVYLVRLPVHPLIMKIDQKLVPDFDEKIQRISCKKSVPYLDLTYLNSELKYTDGNHLFKDSGKIVTEIIGYWIKEQNRTTK